MLSYAIKTSRGYFAIQGNLYWHQATPNGWAAFMEEEDARNAAALVCKEDYTIETIAHSPPVG